jgi:hypothetical protein
MIIKKIDQDNRYKKKPINKDQDITLFQKKIFKMHDCLTLILNSFHCCLTKSVIV